MKIVTEQSGRDRVGREWIPNKYQVSLRFKVTRPTVDKWVESDWFPKKRAKKGWPMDELVPAIDAHREKVKIETGDEPEGDRARKLALECEKLEVVILREREILKQSEIETKRIQDLLSPTLDHQNEVKQLLREIKMCVDSFRKSETARVRKPAEKKLIDGVCDKVLNHMAGQVERYVIKHGIGGDHCESSGGE